MNFYTARVSHPTVQTKASGTVTAGASWSPLSTLGIFAPTGVWVKNGSEDQFAIVREVGSSSGTVLSAGEDRFFPVEFAYQLEVIRGDDTDVELSWHSA